MLLHLSRMLLHLSRIFRPTRTKNVGQLFVKPLLFSFDIEPRSISCAIFFISISLTPSASSKLWRGKGVVIERTEKSNEKETWPVLGTPGIGRLQLLLSALWLWIDCRQLKDAGRVFRLYIKSLGDRAVYRVEESVKMHSPIADALHTIRNPGEPRTVARLERRLRVRHKRGHTALRSVVGAALKW